MLTKVGKKGGEKSTVVQGNKVVCKHVTLHKASEENYQLTTTFDFDDVSREAIMKLAAETLVIRWRTSFKGAETVDESADNQVMSVAKMLQGSKPRMSNKDRATKTLADMSKEERLAFIMAHAKEFGIEVTLPEEPTPIEGSEEDHEDFVNDEEGLTN